MLYIACKFILQYNYTKALTPRLNRRDTMKTEAAIAAATIRKELKKNGIKHRIKSSNYAGGNSIDIYVEDQLPATIERIEDFCLQFRAGYFDSMQDMYVYDHDRTGPTVSFIFVHNEISDERRASAEAFVRSYYADPGVGYDFDRKVWNQLNDKDSAFWKANKPRIAA